MFVNGIFATAVYMSIDTAKMTIDKVKPLIKIMQAVPPSGETEDIADAVVFLRSVEASFVDGIEVVIAGGLI